MPYLDSNGRRKWLQKGRRGTVFYEEKVATAPLRPFLKPSEGTPFFEELGLPPE